MNYRMIRNILGWLLIFECGFMLVPTVTALVYREAQIWYFLATMLLCGGLGGLCVLKKPKNSTLYAREGFVIVSLSWIFLSLFGALPFFLSGCIPNYVDALFETVSGFTTTGASILSEVESLPRCMLMWRSFTHWVGGMGVLVFIMAFVPLSGGQNMHIMKAESPGPSVSKLVPRVKTTALILYSIYLALTLTQFILLLCGSMSPFEALATAFGTAGTGGFGVLNDSMASYSPYIQIVVTVFMLLFSVNFTCYYLFLLGRFKEAFNAEFRRFIYIVGIVILVITLNVRGTFETLGEAVRHVSFTVASLISTSGFATVDFNLWPELSRTLLVLIMFIGACAGSTGGGLKISRLMILLHGAADELGNLSKAAVAGTGKSSFQIQGTVGSLAGDPVDAELIHTGAGKGLVHNIRHTVQGRGGSDHLENRTRNIGGLNEPVQEDALVGSGGITIDIRNIVRVKNRGGYRAEDLSGFVVVHRNGALPSGHGFQGHCLHSGG